MKNIYILLLLIGVSNCLFGYEWGIGADASYAEISGLNAYKADQNYNIQKTKNLIVPSLFSSVKFNNKFKLIFRYSYYDNMISKGASSDSDVFDELEIALQSVVKYRIFETMQEGTFSLKYTIMENKKWNIDVGPSLSIAYSTADFLSVSNVSDNGMDFYERLSSLRSFSETSYGIGAELTTTFKISKKYHLSLNYRFTNPSDKDIHLFGIASIYNF